MSHLETIAVEQPQKVRRFLRRPEVERRTGLTRSTIYEHMEAGTFPRQIRLGPSVVAWIESEIEEWMSERIAASRGEEESEAAA